MPHSHIVLDLTLSVTGMQERMSIDRPTNLLGAFAFGLSDEITAPPKRQGNHRGCTPAAPSLIGHRDGRIKKHWSSCPIFTIQGNDGQPRSFERGQVRSR